MRCSRRIRDPLVRALLDLRVNLLEIPRQNVDLGSVFVAMDGLVDVLAGEHAFDAVLDVSSQDTESSEVEQIAKTVSGDLDLASGASVVGRMLASLGLAFEETKFRAGLERKGAHTVNLRVHGLKVSRLRLTSVGAALQCRALRPLPPPFDAPRTSWYVCTGTWSARSLEFSVKAQSGEKVEIAAGMHEIVETEGKVSVSRGTGAEILFLSEAPLVFGVELMRIDRGPDGLRLADFRPDHAVRGDASETDTLSEIASDPEEAFLRLRSV